MYKVVICLLVPFVSFGSYGQFSYQFVKENGIQRPNGEVYLEGMVSVSDEIDEAYSFEISTRGNGVLRCGETKLHVFDNYYEGTTYLLNIDFCDVNDDGYKDMLIYGAVKYSTEKDRSSSDEVENVVFIYAYNKAERSFSLSYRNASFDLSKMGDANTQWWNRVMNAKSETTPSTPSD